VKCREILWKIKTLCRVSCTAAQLTALLSAAIAACNCPGLKQYHDYYTEVEPRQDIYANPDAAHGLMAEVERCLQALD
jgi:hypothetical protein